MSNRVWWLGFNNDLRSNKARPDGTPSQAMFLEDMAPFLTDKSVSAVSWRRHTGNYMKCYGEMRVGDHALLWMGDGALGLPWGVMGFARLGWIDDEQVTLERDWIPEEPWYPGSHEDAAFLLDLLGEGFEPLYKVFSGQGFMDRTSIISAYEIPSGAQLDAIRRRIHRVQSGLSELAA